MKPRHIVYAALAVAGLTCASSAPITWGDATDTLDPTSVLTDGLLIEAINGTPGGGLVSVNGVEFAPVDELLPNGAVSGLLDGDETLDPGLDALLDTLSFGGGSSPSITVGGGALVPGRLYSIQVFFTDLRRQDDSRFMTFGDGLDGEVDVGPRGGNGAFGRNATGTFIADADTQTLSITANGYSNAHISAYQIRSAVGLPVIESFVAAPPAIASGETSTLSWQIFGAVNATIDGGLGGVDSVMGTVIVNPTETTTYTLTATNSAGSVEAEVAIGVDLPVLDPVISEFLASNDNGLVDNFGENPDWIEVFNPNVFAIDLGGYHLTDDLDQPSMWSFPEGTILAGGEYLVVFASGKDLIEEPLHTNFSIGADGGYLAIVAQDGETVVDQFVSYPPQRTDFSYGISAGGTGYFSAPTPEEPNGSAFDGFVSDTNFDIDRGFYETPFTLNISTDTDGATIVYTTDGSEPTLTNGIQASSVNIGETTVLRAAAFKEGLVPTNVDTQTYLFLADVLEQQEMDSDVVGDPAYADELIPALKSVRTLSIVTDPDNLFSRGTGILENTNGRGRDWEREVSIEFLDPEDPGESFQTGVGLRVHGNGSRGSAKNSLRLLFRNDYGAKKLEYPLFGRDWVTDRFNTIVLRAQNANSWTSRREEDRASTTYLQDTFAKDTQGAMGHPTAGSTFVHLYLNGTYWGLYNPTERPDGSFGEDHFGGDDTDYDAVNRRFSVEVLSGTKTHWDEMIAHADTLLDSQEEYETLEAEFIDIDNLIDYMLVHQYMQSRDGPDDFGHNNMRLVRRNNPPGRWRAYAWDMEYSMIDTSGTRDYSYPFPDYSSTRTSSQDISDSIAAVYLRLKDNNPEFQLRYADRAHKHLFNGGSLSPEEATKRFDARATEIGSAVVGESARWGDHQRSEPYTRDAEWAAERNRILDEFFPARPGHMIGQLRINGLYPLIDPPVLSQHGGEVPVGFEVSISAANGTIYYTLDGSDPREAWTGDALGEVYSSPLELGETATLKTRLLAADGEWSALSEAQFFVGELANSSNLVVSEIYYNPVGGDENLQFIELRNISDAEIDLTGVSFGDGIDFAFPDNTTVAGGGRILVVSNLARFEAVYGNGLFIAGEFENGTRLARGGEPVSLLAADGTTIREFEYEDTIPWPTAADGLGFSLVLVRPESDPDHGLPESWRSSVEIGGSPGAGDALAFTGTVGSDVNRNGLDDLLDYALGEHALDGVALESGVEGIQFSFNRILSADAADVRPEWSMDLVEWFSPSQDFVLDEQSPITGGAEQVTYRLAPAAVSETGKVFFRLSVEIVVVE